MYNIENVKNLVSAYKDELAKTAEIEKVFQGELEDFVGYVRDFMQLSKMSTITLGTKDNGATITADDVKYVGIINRVILDRMYDDFDVIVNQRLEWLKARQDNLIEHEK